MFTITRNSKFLALVAFALVLALLLPTLVAPSVAHAKAGDQLFQGILQARPAGKFGNWVVAGMTFKATTATQLDTLDGPLVVGACTKVKIRNGAVKKIDSEPKRDCRQATF